MSSRNRRNTRPNRNQGKNKIIAGLLAFVGGTFGLHRFYLNDYGGGLFYIFLFFITIRFFPVTMILGIIEALKLFNMSPEAFDDKYNSTESRRTRRWQGKSARGNRAERRSIKTESTTNRSRSRNAPRYVKKRKSIPKRNPFKSSGMHKYKDFDLDDAIIDFNKALKIAKNDPDIHFYLAAAYSLTEQKDKAYKHLSLSVANGLKDTEKIETYEDLAYVRIQNEYDAFKNNNYKMPVQKRKEKSKEEEVLGDDILLSQLNKLAELRKRGLISEEEFSIEKEKLIIHNK